MNSRCEVMDACYFITLSATFSSTWLHSLTITFWSPSPDHLNELPSTPVECSDDKYFPILLVTWHDGLAPSVTLQACTFLA